MPQSRQSKPATHVLVLRGVHVPAQLIRPRPQGPSKLWADTQQIPPPQPLFQTTLIYRMIRGIGIARTMSPMTIKVGLVDLAYIVAYPPVGHDPIPWSSLLLAQIDKDPKRGLIGTWLDTTAVENAGMPGVSVRRNWRCPAEINDGGGMVAVKQTRTTLIGVVRVCIGAQWRSSYSRSRSLIAWRTGVSSITLALATAPAIRAAVQT